MITLVLLIILIIAEIFFLVRFILQDRAMRREISEIEKKLHRLERGPW